MSSEAASQHVCRTFDRLVVLFDPRFRLLSVVGSAPFDANPDDPEGMLGVNVSCAETDQEAARLRASVEAYYQRLNRGDIGAPPSVEEAPNELGWVPDPTPDSLQPGKWPRQISGSPSTARDLLEQMTDQVGVNKVVVQNLIEDHEDRLRSYELLAEGAGLS